VERREGQKERGRPSRCAPCPPREKCADGGDRPEAPGEGKELARPVGRGEGFHDPIEQVIERRVEGVEDERPPEEPPVSGEPICLKDLVEAVGEVIEPEEADGGGCDEESHHGEGPALARHGGRG
jgi:hypothetical protein